MAYTLSEMETIISRYGIGNFISENPQKNKPRKTSTIDFLLNKFDTFFEVSKDKFSFKVGDKYFDSAIIKHVPSETTNIQYILTVGKVDKMEFALYNDALTVLYCIMNARKN